MKATPGVWGVDRRGTHRAAFRWTRALLALPAVLAPAACGEVLLPDDPTDDPVAVAQAFWTEVDEYYSYFDVKGVDWDAVGATYLARVDAGTSDQELFDILGAMVETLRDGHLVLETPLGTAQWTEWRDAYPHNFMLSALQGYLLPPSDRAVGSQAFWGMVGEGVGYIYLGSFGVDGVGDAMDWALEDMGPLSGLVVDVRDNGGGSDTRAGAAAGRLVRERLHYQTYRYKTGPDHDDFGPEVRGYVEPAGSESFHGPVVVLQNRRTFSAAEGFILMMRARPDVTFVGDHTGGGAGNPISRQLPNGWVVKVPRWQAWAADGTRYEGVGLAPDLAVHAPDGELLNGRDRILERAVELLEGG